MAGARVMNGASNKGIVRGMRRAVVTAVATASLCLPAATLIAQHQNNPHPAPAPRYSAPSRPQASHQQNQNQGRNGQQYQNRAPQQYQNRAPQQYPYRNQQQYQQYRPQGGTQMRSPVPSPYAPQAGVRGVVPNSSYNVPGYGRQGNTGTAQQLYAPPGHLGAWLNTHRNVPVPQQQQMLRSDPSFRQLPQGEQQRVMNQLNRVNQMPDAQRQRTLARAENLERLSPEDRAQVAASARRWSTLAPGPSGNDAQCVSRLESSSTRSAIHRAEFQPLPGSVQPGRAGYPVEYVAC